MVRHISGEGYKTSSIIVKFPKTQWSPSLGNGKKIYNYPLHRAGRLTKLSNQARRTVVKEVTKNPMTTLTEQQSSLADMTEPARRTKVSRALHQSWLYRRVAKWNPLLRKRHMTVCLEFAKRHVKDSEQNIMWSDETNVTLWPE